jgi:hypothetical protein
MTTLGEGPPSPDVLCKGCPPPGSADGGAVGLRMKIPTVEYSLPRNAVVRGSDADSNPSWWTKGREVKCNDLRSCGLGNLCAPTVRRSARLYPQPIEEGI